MFFQRTTHPFTFVANLLINIKKFLRISHNSSAISRSKEILLFNFFWSNNVTVANHYAESAIPHKTVHTQCYTCLCFTLKNLANALQKHFEYDQIKTKIFGLKDKATKPLKREKGMNHKLPSFRCSLKIQRYLFL